MHIISYYKHPTGNYVAKYNSQSIMVLQTVFRRITGVSPASVSGWTEVEKQELSQLGFIAN
ncbi:hypothetical protein PM3016_1455 [Paenibacillus mucilaginosus 3016]|uniref:Uncharacterized protein n=1 Tax=Paenibacillus mucilaginosus 3016 TaxID=1116391 RepID=H6NGT8_9BACL|nr:hypothetical protein PM3016_1455 [Paenibacillus mucilaginosus 3016]WFA17180.1 hypothetical protein ERY13_07650 [Paenibacillus mucilaginosus]